jgi:hypothetical protein
MALIHSPRLLLAGETFLRLKFASWPELHSAARQVIRYNAFFNMLWP